MLTIDPILFEKLFYNALALHKLPNCTSFEEKVIYVKDSLESYNFCSVDIEETIHLLSENNMFFSDLPEVKIALEEYENEL